MKKQSWAAILVIILAFITIHASAAPPAPLENYPLNGMYNDSFPQGIDDGFNDEFSAQLTQFQEPSLYRMPDNGRVVYRTTILESFCDPLTIRVELNPTDNSGVLFYKRTNYQTQNDNTEGLIENRRIALSPAQVSELLKLMNDQGFWSTPSKGGDEGLDGGLWVIEGLQSGKYHVVIRWCPQDDPAWYISVFFMKLVNPDYSELFQRD